MPILQSQIKKLPYQKIIVWCGMIEECLKTARKMEALFFRFYYLYGF